MVDALAVHLGLEEAVDARGGLLGQVAGAGEGHGVGQAGAGGGHDVGDAGRHCLGPREAPRLERERAVRRRRALGAEHGAHGRLERRAEV